MKSLVYNSAYNLSFTDTDMPILLKNEVLVEVSFVGICGTDLHCYHGNMDSRVNTPVILGHEFSGIIVDSNGHNNMSVGDRVTVEPIVSCGKCYSCQVGEYNLCVSLNLKGIDSSGAFAEFIKVPVNKIYKLKDSTSLAKAALVEPFAVCMHSLSKAKLQQEEYILIIGSGPIGIITAIIAREQGLNVIISEINNEKVKYAKKLGFIIVNPLEQNLDMFVKRITNGRGANATIEATGTNQGLKASIDNTIIKGKVVIVGLPAKEYQIDTYKVIAKELQIIGSRVYKKEDYISAIDFVESNGKELDVLINRIVNFEDAIKLGFEKADKGHDTGKVLVSIKNDI